MKDKLIGNWKLEIGNCRKGFTLIELLIVIAIIGVLATLLMVNFVGVRQRARDAQRKSDLRQLQSALEIWRSDHGSYPASGSEFGPCGSPLESGNTVYMAKIPCDPSNTGQYVYTYVSSGTTNSASYSLYACLENVGDSQKDSVNNSTYCTGGTTNWSFTLNNP
jgi:general secretion pathway protein G